jgi:multicomponent K+:H+ antiporter subunit D
MTAVLLWMQSLMPHLVIVPILLPMGVAALMLFFGERRRPLKVAVGVAATLAQLLLALALLAWVRRQDAATAFGVYLPSNWEVPFGIVLTLDRLSALMLVVTALAGCAAQVYALARWHRAGMHFQPLLQIQLMGLNGAFLTADLFNLFVFFEVMLAASYGLLLHGSGPTRVKAGLHYIVVNLVASALFLIGVSLVYGISGTLNMADLARRIPTVAAADVALLHAGLAILGVAFLTKAALWPLHFWLVPGYTAAGAPAACVFALLTKVGVYVLLRLSTLLFPESAGASAGFGGPVLLWGGIATLAVGALGMLISQRPARLAGHAVIASSGTLMATIGLADARVTGAALYYLPASTLAVCAFYLLLELIERARHPEDERAPEDEEDRLPYAMAELEIAAASRSVRDVNLDERLLPLVGRAIPGSTALLGLAFIVCTLLIAGLPPLSGFVAKFALLDALLDPLDRAGSVGAARWTLFVLLIVSGLMALVGLTRVGIRHFWAPQGRAPLTLQASEVFPIVALLALCAALAVRAEPALRYARATAEALYQPSLYIGAVMGARPRPNPTPAQPAAVAGGTRP